MSNLVVENYNLNNYTGYVDPDMVDNPLDQSPLYFKVHREQLVGDTHINRVGMPFQYRTPLYGLFRDNGSFLGAHTEKYSVMENVNEIARLAIRTCGGQSMLKSQPLERFYRDSRCGALMLPWTAELCMDMLGKGALYEQGESDEN